MSEFVFDSLVGFIGKINPRNEKHGEDDVLAVDVPITLQPGESGERWNDVLDVVAGEDGAEYVAENSYRHLDKMHFIKAFEDYRVHIWISNKKLATLNPCRINKFHIVFATEKHDEYVKFRLQANVTGKEVGALAELMGHAVRLEILGPDQEELFEGEAA